MIKVIGRKWQVQSNFKSSSSVITFIAHMDTRTNLQCSSEAAPSSWQKYDTDSKSMVVEKLEIHKSCYTKNSSMWSGTY